MNWFIKALILQAPYAYFLCTGLIQSQLKHSYEPKCLQKESQRLQTTEQSFVPQQQFQLDHYRSYSIPKAVNWTVTPLCWEIEHLSDAFSGT